MKRHKYQQPSILVVRVAPHTMLATSSEGVMANRSGYGEAKQSDWNESAVKAYKNPVNWEE